MIGENFNGEYEVIVGNSNGQIIVYDLGSLPGQRSSIKSVIEFDSNIVVKQISSSNSYFSFIADSSLSTTDPLFYDSEGNSYSFNG